jgi:multidrug resistance efflux pump
MKLVVAESEADLRASEARYSDAAHEQQVMIQLVKGSAATSRETDLADTKMQLMKSEYERAHAIWSRNKEELAGIAQDIYLSENVGRNDLPYAQQRLHEVSMRDFEVSSLLAEAEGELEQLAPQIREAAELVASRTKQTVNSPVEGLVWRRRIVKGAKVDEHAELARIMDPSRCFIEAALSPKDFTIVRIGDKVRVEIDGSPIRVTGEVTHMLGPGLGTEDGLDEGYLVADIPKLEEEDFRVYVKLHEPLPGACPDNFYYAGAKVEIRIAANRLTRTMDLLKKEWESWND